MKTTHRFATFVALASGFILTAGNASAQSAGSTQGLIGKRYAGIDYAYSNYSGSTIGNSNGAVVSGNLPVFSKWDLGASWEYGYASSSGYSRQSHTINVTALTYNTTEYGKAYLSANIGTGWDQTKVAGVKRKDDGQIWGIGAGVEFPVGDLLAMDAGVNFSDAITGKRGSQVTYHLSGNQWLTPEVAAVATVSYNQISKGPDAVSFRIGVRMTF